mgnify:CR=1 FL=1
MCSRHASGRLVARTHFLPPVFPCPPHLVPANKNTMLVDHGSVVVCVERDHPALFPLNPQFLFAEADMPSFFGTHLVWFYVCFLGGL